MNYIMITGSSKGLGAAISTLLLDKPDTTLLCIARTRNKDLEQFAEQKNVPYFFYPFDLDDIKNIPAVVSQLFTNVMLEKANHVHLINNAGMLEPIKPMDRTKQEEIITNIQVNLLAPMLLTTEFLKKTKNFRGEKRIINISSGAGQRPIYGWGCYGTSKAGLDLFSQTTALEQAHTKFPTKICSFGPGIMDTSMQQQIRTSPKQDFIDVEAFQTYKEEDKLLPPSLVAKVVVDLLHRDDFPNGQVVNVSQYF
ncbi:(S)-benzoin forming benzil reductase [Halalkalibacter okhensis]|uniref:Short-chain dehydrogenase n=1 Tax=Halalkalibacter okhensis TaxID=333138 RepID=A0A0B0IKB2_9BACI|nr:(S)-benzoin forming benzil reductase [Halalkalibacter okhensis]KHF41302.1 short-chain dehydrogenase [Halalkalibacter okhensis]